MLPTITVSEIKKQARLFGIPPRPAIRMRLKYLAQEWNRWEQFETIDNPWKMPIPYHDYTDILSEARTLLVELITYKPAGRITSNMKEQALSVPMNRILDFQNGKCRCPFHEDMNPSMYHATRKNLACCPVCNQYFDTIAIIRHMDGLSFEEAIQKLCRL